MSHPYVLIVAVVATAPLLVPLAHVFFGTWSQFAEETGLVGRDDGHGLRGLWSRFTAHASDVVLAALLDLMGLIVAYALVLFFAYHAMLWSLPILCLDP